MRKAILLNSNDNVATLLDNTFTNEDIEIIDTKNSVISVVRSLDFIPRGHKIALKNISEGENIIKYGFVIGCATKDIKPCQYVHVHNLSSLRGRGDLA